MSNTSFKIETSLDHAQNCLKFKLDGRLTKETSMVACEALAKEFTKLGAYNHYVIVVDCTNMKGFDKMVKKEWLTCLTTFENRISKVVIVSKNIFIGAAAHMMLKFFSFEKQLAKSYQSADILNIHSLRVA